MVRACCLVPYEHHCGSVLLLWVIEKRKVATQTTTVDAKIPTCIEGCERLHQLLVIHQELGDKRPMWSLKTFAIEQLKKEDISYYALSYPWGDPTDFAPSAIIINGHQVRVTRNLGMALEAFMGALGQGSCFSSPRRIWVDALCINQDEVIERNAQVSIVGRLYAGASTVLARLGPEDEASVRLFETLSGPCNGCSDLRPSHSQGPRLNEVRPDGGKFDTRFITGKRRETLLKDLELLSRRPYWLRAWIRQELHFARHVILLCGARTASPVHLSMLTRVLSEGSQSEAMDTMTSLVESAADFEGYKHRLSLLKLLERHHRSQCSIPHDHIYSLLAMAEDVPQAEGFQIDYRASYEEVVVKTAAFCDAVGDTRLLSLLGKFDTPLSVMRRCAEHYRSLYQKGEKWKVIWQLSYPELQDHYLHTHEEVTEIESDDVSRI